MLAALRRWLDAHGYVETPTPVRVASPALETELYAFPSGDRWLRTSPEFALKRVLASGLPRIYELGPCLRAREQGPWHLSEFHMLEWYRTGASLPDLMAEVRALIDAAADAIGVSRVSGWRRTTVRDRFQQVTGIDLASADAAALSSRDPDWNTAFFRRWVEDVEPTLTEPTFVEGWPASQAALATVRTDGEMPIAERFEVFLGGVELANAFHELGDARTLEARWKASNAARVQRGDPPHPIDRRFLEAIDRLPRSSGIALGVDRLIAVLCGWEDLRVGQVD